MSIRNDPERAERLRADIEDSLPSRLYSSTEVKRVPNPGQDYSLWVIKVYP